MHGNNCIGNNGKNQFTPVIGDNLDLGFAVKIIGKVTLGSDVTVGANALVNKSFGSNCILVGLPAKQIEN